MKKKSHGETKTGVKSFNKAPDAIVVELFMEQIKKRQPTAV